MNWRTGFCLAIVVSCASASTLQAQRFPSLPVPLPGPITHKEAKVASQLAGVIRPCDELWIINTRSASPGVCSIENLDGHTLVYQQIDGCYHSTTASHLLQQINDDNQRQTVVFIHGNRTDYKWARLRGTQTYETIMDVAGQFLDHQDLSCQLPLSCDNLPPVRWIIWSWPTDTIRGPRRDLEVKRARASSEGQILAQFLGQVKQPEMGVLAYSLGAQALVSALCCWQQQAAMSGSQPASVPPVSLSVPLNESGVTSRLVEDDAALPQNTISQTGCHGPRLRVVMVAAAVPTDWFRTQLGRDCMLQCTQSLTLINNPGDRVLDVYQKLTHRGPLGRESCISSSWVPTSIHLVQSRALNNHVLTEYFASESTRQQVRQALFPPVMVPELVVPETTIDAETVSPSAPAAMKLHSIEGR